MTIRSPATSVSGRRGRDGYTLAAVITFRLADDVRTVSAAMPDAGFAPMGAFTVEVGDETVVIPSCIDNDERSAGSARGPAGTQQVFADALVPDTDVLGRIVLTTPMVDALAITAESAGDDVPATAAQSPDRPFDILAENPLGESGGRSGAWRLRVSTAPA